jgi:hypothetical protein
VGDVDLSSQAVVLSPVDHIDVTDPGDQTQRNFRYQHGFGAIILVAAINDQLPYVALWCEQHEDFLAERADGTFDAYQVKTAKPENGSWTWSSPELRKSIKRFCKLEKGFPGRVREFVFVSNVECLDNNDKDSDHRCPGRLLRALSADSMSAVHTEVYAKLLEDCECDGHHLDPVLRNLKFKKGAGREEFEHVISHVHLASLKLCKSLSAAKLNECRDRLLEVIHRASALSVEDPSKHLPFVQGGFVLEPTLKAKRVDLLTATSLLTEIVDCAFRYAPADPILKPGVAKRDMSVLEKKLGRGNLSAYLDMFRDRAIAAERVLMEKVHEDLESSEVMRAHLEKVVHFECLEAQLAAALSGTNYGHKMLVDVHERLRRVVSTNPSLVFDQPYEVLAGIAGLLTENCTVWWSEKFDLGGSR